MKWYQNVFKRATPLEVAAQELIEAEHALLVALTGKEWAEALVKYNSDRITRLKLTVKGGT